ncbi:hypothetical protein QN277_010180 [Acacia crassicarpa]|uniref:Peptidase A1 domain-containing protein n=1 Tax=Acacia crassicarpa TaxID=499986 RepID=A0AAE1INB3_9FABA|nr:hypothetical protein QN277_010180 [Acacia crassicarpa]
MNSLIVLFLLSLFSLSTSINGLSINFDIVHRDSPLSPFYNSSSSLSELARNARLRSLRRYNRRHLLQTDMVTPIHVDEAAGEYLMRIYVGSPPVESWAIADTGSDLIWVQCLPCNTCYPQDASIFNPLKSSTYQVVSCNSEPCSFLPKNHSTCGISSQCVYGYAYADNSTTSGDLGKDMFSFGGNGNGSLLVFGCGHNNTGTFSRKGSGLVGLGAGPLSLVSQLGPDIDHKFSYCLVPYFSNYTGKLKMGQEANISASSNGVVSTPYTLGGVRHNHYMLTLEGVSIGNNTVETSGVNKREGNAVIDSGTTFFYMETSFYNKIEALIKNSIGVQEVKNVSNEYNLCYSNNDTETIMNNFPDFVVHYKGGADVHLKPEYNIFLPQDDFICLTIFPVDHDSLAVGIDFDIGNIAQINFQVEYDLGAKQISFAPANCSNY